MQRPTYQQLLDRVEELEALLGLKRDLVEEIRYSLGCTPQVAQIVAMLYRREECSKESIHIVLHGMKPEDRQPELKVLDCQISYARACLRERGIEIETIWRFGWRMPQRSKQVLRELLEQEDVMA